jgi:predicted dehydrogenase
VHTTRRVKWGVLGVARIATRKVIPALQGSRLCEVVAIASRDGARAAEAARALDIPRAYASYEDLLADAEVEAVYIPLPNHLHVPWAARAMEAGKHVLCEKPIALGAAEAAELLAVRDRTGRKVQEAFMVRTHPQWLAVSRFLFGEEPRRAAGLVERDPRFGIDRLTSAMLEFTSGHSTFTCGTQVVPYQRVQVMGSTGRIEVEIPFNAPNDRPCRVLMDDGRDVFGGGVEEIRFEVCDQYAIQGDLFSKAILEDGAVPVPLEDAVLNMRAIEAVFRSSESGRWEPV